MTSQIRARLLALTLAAATLAGTAVPSSAAAIGSGALALSPGKAAVVTDVGYWYRGRWYPNGGWYGGRWYPYGCGNCGAAVGAGVALGILGAAAIAGAAASPPPPPPVVYYEQPPVVYVEPTPRPRSCWVVTGPGGAGYWSPC